MIFERLNSIFKKNNPEPDVSQLDNRRIFRTDLLSDKDKKKLSKKISTGEILDFYNDDNRIAETIGRREYSRIRHESLAADKQELIDNGEKRRTELLASGREKESFLLDVPVNIFSIHSDNIGSAEDISKNLSRDINRNLIEVDYQENTSNEATNSADESDKIFKLIDSSGKIDKKFISSLIDNQDKASFTMLGGNLRGCFLSALDSVITSSDVKDRLEKLDIHIPLDKCYDDDTYEEITGYRDIKAAIQDRMLRENSELYEDRRLTLATGKPEELESKYRFYLWSDSKVMESEMNNQIELEKLRKELK